MARGLEERGGGCGIWGFGLIVFALVTLALSIGSSEHTLTNWLESCGGCCTARKLCSDLSHISDMGIWGAKRTAAMRQSATCSTVSMS